MRTVLTYKEILEHFELYWDFYTMRALVLSQSIYISVL